MNTQEVKKNSFRAWILAARPKTLSGASVPVIIGSALAWADCRRSGADFSVVCAVLCLLFAFVMQIDANLVNDLFDYLSGRDDRETRLGPKRACAEGWISAEAMKWGVGVVTLVACLIGLPLIIWGGVEMVLVGLLCVGFCFLYTTTLSGRGLGDVLVLVFFGIVPVCITYYLQVQTVTWTVFVASLACGLVIDGLLVVNNFRDRDNDRAAGKRTLIVMIGEQPALTLYLMLGVAAFVMGAMFLFNGHPMAFVLPVIYIVLHIRTYMEMKRIFKGRELNRCLAETARNMLVYGLCVGAGLIC